MSGISRRAVARESTKGNATQPSGKAKAKSPGRTTSRKPKGGKRKSY